MFYLVPPGYRQLLLIVLKSWVKGIVLLPAILTLGVVAILAALAFLLGVSAGEVAADFLNSLGDYYASLIVPVVQFWITAYLLAALFFVTGWESARPASWRLPLLFLLPCYERLLRRRLRFAVSLVNAWSPALRTAFDRSRYFPPGPPGLTPPALCAGIAPLRE